MIAGMEWRSTRNARVPRFVLVLLLRAPRETGARELHCVAGEMRTARVPRCPGAQGWRPAEGVCSHCGLAFPFAQLLRSLHFVTACEELNDVTTSPLPLKMKL